MTPPTRVKELRTASESDEPITVWSSVVSVVRRDKISPVLAVSALLGSGIPELGQVLDDHLEYLAKGEGRKRLKAGES